MTIKTDYPWNPNGITPGGSGPWFELDSTKDAMDDAHGYKAIFDGEHLVLIGFDEETEIIATKAFSSTQSEALRMAFEAHHALQGGNEA